MTTECFGIATLSAGFYDHKGVWKTVVCGYLRVVTDKHWSPDFRSSERWQLCVCADAESEPIAMIPGCSVKGICRGIPDKAIFESRNEFFDARGK